MDFLPFVICLDGSARRLVGPEGFVAMRLNTSSLRILGKEVRGGMHGRSFSMLLALFGCRGHDSTSCGLRAEVRAKTRPWSGCS